MPLPPAGTITFLFSDIEGSTRLWERHPEVMRPALARHDALLRQAIEGQGGYVFKTVGDAFCAAFPTAPDALAAALAAQTALNEEPWPDPLRLTVRMALHTGAAEERGGDYFGPPLNRVARLLAAGHGGQTLLSEVTQGLTRDTLPASVTLRDLGEHRLRDLGRPEQVFQLLHPALPADFPPLRSLENPALPNNLPSQATSFIGREKQVAEVKALLAKTRLLTLTGAGGSGKTRLSLQVAADLLDGEGDGVWLVELAPLADPALVPQAVAQALGVQERAGQPIQQTLVEWLKPKRLLLVLDNCEHLVSACASLAADLLRGCPQVHILASSREPLNVAGEQTYRVPPLSLPDPKKTQTPESLSQYESVSLFIQRAQAVQPLFLVTNANAPAVAQVCFHLDGIPLAIELAAARVRAMPVEQVNARLDQRFRLLTGGSRSALPRQQTLRALLDWSYDLLTEAEKTLLRRTSVFAGGWTLEAAEAVCAGDGVEDWEVLDLLTSLVDKSLVVYEEPEARYGLLETVRQYAEERLSEQGEIEEVRDKHYSWYLALAEAARPQLSGPDQGRWISRLQAEHDNLRASLAWADASSNCVTGGTRLAWLLTRFWDTRGYWSEAQGHLMTALTRESVTGWTLERVRALEYLGWFTRVQGDWETALLYCEQALAGAREIGDRVSEANCLNGLGAEKHIRGDLAAAYTYYEQAMAVWREIGNKTGEALTYANFGSLKHDQGDLAVARSYYEQALTINHEAGRLKEEANLIRHLGYMDFAQGDWKAAGSHYEQALAISREIGNIPAEASCLACLGNVARSQGDLATARSYYEQALAICREIGNRSDEANNLTNLGAMAREQGDWAQSREFFAESLTLKREFGSAASDLYTVEEWAALALAEGDAPRAARLAGAAQAGREAINEHVLPEQQATHERTLSAARAALGEDAFAAAWDAGRAMTPAEAVEYALSGLV